MQARSQRRFIPTPRMTSYANECGAFPVSQAAEETGCGSRLRNIVPLLTPPLSSRVSHVLLEMRAEERDDEPRAKKTNAHQNRALRQPEPPPPYF